MSQDTLRYDCADPKPELRRNCVPLVRDGRLKFKEDIVEGLEKVPPALMGMLEGRNFGKLTIPAVC